MPGAAGRTDIHTVTQHASVQENVFANAGAEKLGRSGPFGPG
jgi:hypothetical protein